MTKGQILSFAYYRVGTTGPDVLAGASLITSSTIETGSLPAPAMIASVTVVVKKPTANIVVKRVNRLANLLTRLTTILAVGFFTTTVTLAIMAGAGKEPVSIVDDVIKEAPAKTSGPVVPTR